MEEGSQGNGRIAGGILDESAHGGHDVTGTEWDRNADLAQDTAGGVDACGALGEVGGAKAVEGRERVLVE